MPLPEAGTRPPSPRPLPPSLMRILWVKAGRILPVDTGGKIRSFNLLRALQARHELTFLSFYDGARDDAYEREVAEQFPGAVTIATGLRLDAPHAAGWHYLTKLVSSAPYAVTKFTHAAVRRVVADGMRERRYDVMVSDFLSASRNFPEEMTVPAVLFQHNVESALWARQAAHERHPIRRLAFRMEAAKMRRYERRTVARFHHVVAVSEHDRALMRGMAPGERITVVPTGVDVGGFRAARGGGDGAIVLFLGSMDWEANVDGVEWFLSSVWPTVHAAVPEARFRVVGRNPHPRIRALASDTVDIAGGVPSVIPHLRESSVFVVPLRIGGGTRLKIFEAMAAGKAVVSTRVGAEGLDVQDGENILLEDSADGFATAVIGLLQDRPRRARLEQAAMRLAERFDWSAVVGSFEDALRHAMECACGAEGRR